MSAGLAIVLLWSAIALNALKVRWAEHVLNYLAYTKLGSYSPR